MQTQTLSTIKKISNSIITELKFDASTKIIFEKYVGRKDQMLILSKWTNYCLCYFWTQNINLTIKDWNQQLINLTLHLTMELKNTNEDFILCKKHMLESIKQENMANPIHQKNIETMAKILNQRIDPSYLKYFSKESYKFICHIFQNQLLKQKIQNLFEFHTQHKKQMIRNIIDDPDYFNIFESLTETYKNSINFSKSIRFFIENIKVKSKQHNSNKIKNLISNYVDWWKCCKQNDIFIFFCLKNENETITKTIQQFLKIVIFHNFSKDMGLKYETGKFDQLLTFYKNNLFDIVLCKTINGSKTKIHNFDDPNVNIIKTINKMKLID